MSKFNQAQSQNQQSATEGGQEQGFFNLHVQGCGYLNRVRWVPVKGRGRNSEPFLACAINAMHGPVDKPNYSYMDLRVSGEEAIEIVDSLAEAVDARKKVFVAFRVGDIYAHGYEREVKDARGAGTGRTEAAAVIKGRLLLITCAKVDDEVVYRLDDEGGEGNLPQQAQSTEDDRGAESGPEAGAVEAEQTDAPDDGERESDINRQGHQRGRFERASRSEEDSNVTQGRFQRSSQSSPQGRRGGRPFPGRTGTNG